MTTAIIVQARMSSTRLPGKVMRQVAGMTLLEWNLRRCLATPGVDVVCCATVDTPDCDVIAAEARRVGAEVFRGSETDVLGRYHGAGRSVGADIVMRVTSDCPLIDPAVCGAVLTIRADAHADYACNNMPASWPHGLDCEAFTTDALGHAARSAMEAEEREHVTPFLRRGPQFSKVSLRGPGEDWARLRWTLDTDKDLAFFEALLPLLTGIEADTRAIWGVLATRPDIVALNASMDHRAADTADVPNVPYTSLLAALPSIATANNIWASV